MNLQVNSIEPGSASHSRCPQCDSKNVRMGTTIDPAFGDEIPCQVCENCGDVFDLGIYPAEES